VNLSFHSSLEYFTIALLVDGTKESRKPTHSLWPVVNTECVYQPRHNLLADCGQASLVPGSVYTVYDFIFALETHSLVNVVRMLLAYFIDGSLAKCWISFGAELIPSKSIPVICPNLYQRILQCSEPFL
jgi:hypothetical protein